MGPKRAKTHRFTALDGMRGVCALMVVFFHAFRLAPHYRFEHGYLSVDVFFILSGFVLSFAYAGKLTSAFSLDAFLRARFVRLWPVLILAAVLSGIGLLLTEYALNLPRSGLIAAGVGVLESIFLIPHFGGNGLAFPLNGNLWSLFAEFWVNVAFALFIVRLRTRDLATIMLLAWAFFAFEAYRAGTVDIGPRASTAIFAVPRAIPSFICGVWLYRLWQERILDRLPSVPPIVVYGIWIGITLLPTDRFGVGFDLFQIVVTMPLLVALLASWSGSTPALATWLGRISYPLYATQSIFVVGLLQRALMRGSISFGAEIATVALSLATAAIIAHWCEPALRRSFGRVIGVRSAEPHRARASALPG